MVRVVSRTTEKFMRSLLKELSDDRFSQEDLKHFSATTSHAAISDEETEESAYQTRRRRVKARLREANLNPDHVPPPPQPQPQPQGRIGRRGRKPRGDQNVPAPPPLP
jgi:hypothetical protein